MGILFFFLVFIVYTEASHSQWLTTKTKMKLKQENREQETCDRSTTSTRNLK